MIFPIVGEILNRISPYFCRCCGNKCGTGKREKIDGRSYPFYSGLLLDRVQIPVNVGGRSGSASGAFDRVGFASRKRLLCSTDDHPHRPHCESNNKMRFVNTQNISTKRKQNDNFTFFDLNLALVKCEQHKTCDYEYGESLLVDIQHHFS
jgi:hypothetical protein